MTLFSIVIPTLNAPTLKRTLEALKRQTIPSDCMEVIVVGVDESLKTGAWGRFYSTGQAVFPGTARNRGAALANGEILAFTDADCIPEPNWLAVLAERFSDPATAVMGGGVAFQAENYWTLTDNISMFHDYLSSLPAGQREQLPSLNLAIRREVFLQSGGFDEQRRTGEDSDLTIRLREYGYVLRFEPSAAVTHAPSRSQAMEVFRHHFLHGLHSVKFDFRYQKRGIESLLGNSWVVLLVSPLLAAGITAKIFLGNRHLWRYWYTAPAIFSAKLVWCFGAALRLYKNSPKKQN